jgi:circadian clock protein KaiC
VNADSENAIGEVAKAKTGIEGFDQVTRGGLPFGGVTLVSGGSGSGKTIFALETLVNGATLYDECGLFIAFEESSRKILTNAASFGWPLEELRDQKLFFLDAMPTTDSVTIGEFDLSGMLAILLAKVEASRIKRVVFDSLDVLLHLLPSVSLRRREMQRLHSWLLEHQLTTIVTAKTDWLGNSIPIQDSLLQYLPFMVDCVVSLTHGIENEYSRRRLRIIKYRGSSFSENEIPFTINRHGLDVATADVSMFALPASTERVSTGILQLDQMLFGGVMRGSTT